MYAESLRPEQRSILAAWTLPPPKRKPLLAAVEPEIENLIAAGYVSRFPNGSLYLADGGKLVLGAKMKSSLEQLAEVMRARGETLPAANEPSSAALPCPDCEALPGQPHSPGCSIVVRGEASAAKKLETKRSKRLTQDYRVECESLRSEVQRLKEQIARIGHAARNPTGPKLAKGAPADPFATPAKALAAWHAAGGEGAPRIPGWSLTVAADFERLSPAAFRAAMAARVEGTRELAQKAALFAAERSALVGHGQGLHRWDPRLRTYRLGSAKDALAWRVAWKMHLSAPSRALLRIVRRSEGIAACRAARRPPRWRDLSRFGWTEEDFASGGVALS
jgi:hypothetical protein